MRRHIGLTLLCAGLAWAGCGEDGSGGNDITVDAADAGDSAGGTGGTGSGGSGLTGGLGVTGGSTTGATGSTGSTGSTDSTGSTGSIGSTGSGSTGALTCDGVGVCGDNFEDVCDVGDDSCPTTQASGIDEPEWDCAGSPPSNVYAYATFDTATAVAGANLKTGACVVFFEGAPDLFYTKWFNFGPETTARSCTQYAGCICPTGGIPPSSFDRRLYAFTWDGSGGCPDISLIDHGNADGSGKNNAQAVSNECRKYLYALHGDGSLPIYAPDGTGAFDLPFSYVAGGLPELEKRLSDFPKVEVACVQVKPFANLSYAQLWAEDVQLNPDFVKK